jgi:pyrimidine deaminase RibD-like protein
MELAITLAWKAPQSAQAYSVGAVIVGADGRELSRGYSREGGDPHVHAEEAALGKLEAGAGQPGALLAGATVYSTLEPCSQRKSRPRSCTQLILAAGIRRVVVAWREPGLFVADCRGIELLGQAGVEVTELGEVAGLAMAPNRHLSARFGDSP